MKYVVLVGDGMADYPIDELGGITPLEAAKTPNMDYIVKNGQAGIVKTIPRRMAPASDVAILSILGYDPLKYYTGRGPLEAKNLGVELGEEDIAFRCNFITATGDKLVDYSAGHITTKEAHILIDYLNKKLGSESVKFYPGVSYRNLMVVRNLGLNAKCVPPHDIAGKKISDHLPVGIGAERLAGIMRASRPILEAHDINHVRIDLKENPANMIWLWGQGKKPDIPKFKEKFNVTGTIISAVDLVNGIGKTLGLNVVKVPGATGYYDTDYLAKAEYGLKALEKQDFLFIHVEAPDEAGHNGDLRQKIKAIEKFDSLVVGTILNHFKKTKDFRILILPDHYTPISLRTHTAEPVFFALYGWNVIADDIDKFNEAATKKSSLKLDKGWKLMEHFLQESSK